MSTTDFLGKLSETGRSALLANATRLRLRKGDFVFRNRDTGDSVFILLAGRLKTYKIAPNGKEVILWFIFPGELFGFVETPREKGRMVNVQACEGTEVARISGPFFREFLLKHPDISQLCVRVVASRLGMLANRLVYLTNDNAEARIAKFLLDLDARYHGTGGSADHPLDLTHQEIANISGVQRQTVTRILGKFSKRGALTVQYRHISIRDHDLLARYAARHPEKSGS